MDLTPRSIKFENKRRNIGSGAAECEKARGCKGARVLWRRRQAMRPPRHSTPRHSTPHLSLAHRHCDTGDGIIQATRGALPPGPPEYTWRCCHPDPASRGAAPPGPLHLGKLRLTNPLNLGGCNLTPLHLGAAPPNACSGFVPLLRCCTLCYSSAIANEYYGGQLGTQELLYLQLQAICPNEDLGSY